MPYVLYKGSLLSLDEYEKLKEILDKEEMEYIKLLLGEVGENEDLKEENKESKDHKEENFEEKLQAGSFENPNGEPNGVDAEEEILPNKEDSEGTQESDTKTHRRRRSR